MKMKNQDQRHWMEEMKKKRLADIANEIKSEAIQTAHAASDQVQAQIQGDPVMFGRSIVNEVTNEVTKSFDFDMSM